MAISEPPDSAVGEANLEFTESAPGRVGFAAKARSAVIWNTGFNVFRQLLQFGVMLVMVRLLKPAAYGEFALVTSITGFLAIFSFNNFVAHTLQVRDDSEIRYQEQFTAGGIINLTLFLVANTIAVFLRWLPAYAPVAPLIHAVSVVFLLEWPCELRRKMLERNYDWRRLRLLHASGLIFSAVVAIAMGWAGAGVYALVVPGMIVTLPFSIDLFLIQRWRPNWAWSWQNYRATWHFGVTRVGSGLAATGKQLLESSTLAKILGFTALGFFNRSVGLATMFCQQISAQFMYAIYPVLTRLDPKPTHVSRVNGLVLRIVAWTVIPIAAAFGILAPALVQTIYGAKWSSVVPMLPFAMLWGIFAALAIVTDNLLLAQRQQKRCLFVDILVLAGTGALLLFLLPHGTKIYLLGMAGLYFVTNCLSLFWLAQLKAITTDGIFSAALPPVFSSLAAVLICETGKTILSAETNSFLNAAFYGIAFFVFYFAIVRLFFFRLLTELVAYLPAQKQIGRVLFLKPQS